MSAAYVYEVYDAEGRLIYVGCSRDVLRRMEQHVTDSWWFGQVVKIRAYVMPSLTAARDEERRRIADLSPRWNLGALPPRRTWTQQRYDDYLTARVRVGTADRRENQWRRMAAEYRYRFGAEYSVPDVNEITVVADSLGVPVGDLLGTPASGLMGMSGAA